MRRSNMKEEFPITLDALARAYLQQEAQAAGITEAQFVQCALSFLEHCRTEVSNETALLVMPPSEGDIGTTEFVTRRVDAGKAARLGFFAQFTVKSLASFATKGRYLKLVDDPPPPGGN